MMLLSQHFRHKPDRAETRKRVVDKQLAYQQDCRVEITRSGPLMV